MSLFENTKARMQELGIQPKRSMGQNFLISDRVVERILQKVAAFNPSHLVEVGPGLGALTDSLRTLERPLQVIELDHKFAEYWRAAGVNVAEVDALKLNWEELNLPAKTALVSNLPYQISTGIVVDRTLGPSSISHMVLMFQREVADRLTARPRTSPYGLLTPLMQSHWQIEKVCEAGPRDFFPAPKVASRVLSFARKPSPFPGEERDFLVLVKAAFAQRRKLLLKNLLAVAGKFGQSQAGLEEIFDSLRFDRRARAEELSPEQFCVLYGALRRSPAP